MTNRYFSAIFICVALSGCNKSDSGTQNPLANNQKNAASSLEARISSLESDVFGLSLTASNLAPATVRLDAASKGYALVGTPFGAFPVIVERAAPYLDGYKVTIAIGNLTTATFQNATIHLNWASGTQDTDITSNFVAGRYTNFDVVLSPAKATDLRSIGFSITFNTLFLPH